MILRDLLNHFDIQEDFPQYLYDQTFNEVFKDGDLTCENGNYKIAVTTRQNVTHQMFLKPDEEYPLIILSVLPNGKHNGMKFGLTDGDVKYISDL